MSFAKSSKTRTASRRLFAISFAILPTLLFALNLAGCSAETSFIKPDIEKPAQVRVLASQESWDEPELGPKQEPEATIAKKSDETPRSVPKESSFSVTFLDVGQGDAAIVNCDGRYLLIDGGPPSASKLLYSYCKTNDIKYFDYIVATHADTDHTGGISGALQVAKVGRVFCSVKQATQKSFNSMVRYLNEQNVSLETPAVGDIWQLGNSSVSVVGTGAAGDSSNEGSIMLRIDYGSTSFLFTGDASEGGERNFSSAGGAMECDVLKVAHHGSAVASSYMFLRDTMPKNAVISVGSDNSYGHPTDDTLSRLRDCGATVYRTDIQGDITAISDGKAVTMTTEKNPNANTLIAPGFAAATSELSKSGYIGNKNSKKFHLPTCRSLPQEKNRKYLDSREEAIKGGFDPCGNCKP